MSPTFLRCLSLRFCAYYIVSTIYIYVYCIYPSARKFAIIEIIEWLVISPCFGLRFGAGMGIRESGESPELTPGAVSAGVCFSMA